GDWSVTGVQTCALPISRMEDLAVGAANPVAVHREILHPGLGAHDTRDLGRIRQRSARTVAVEAPERDQLADRRVEEISRALREEIGRASGRERGKSAVA